MTEKYASQCCSKYKYSFFIRSGSKDKYKYFMLSKVYLKVYLNKRICTFSRAGKSVVVEFFHRKYGATTFRRYEKK